MQKEIFHGRVINKRQKMTNVFNCRLRCFFAGRRMGNVPQNRLSLSFERQRVHPHLFHHGEHAVGTGRGEVLFQTDFVDEVEVCVQYFLRGVARHDIDQHGDDSAGDVGVALSLVVDQSVLVLRMYPHFALAAFDEVFVCFVLLVDARVGLAFVYDLLVFVQPVFQEFEFRYDFVLFLRYCHDNLYLI